MTSSPPPSAGRLGRFLRKLLMLGISSLLGLIVLEFGIRTFLPFYHPASQIEFRRNPGGVALGPANGSQRHRQPKGDYDLVVTFNEAGLRDDKPLRDCRPDDWIVLGDSFSLGWGVEVTNRFSTRLQSLLGRPVFNVAIPGDLRDYRHLLDYAVTNGAHAKHLVLGLCMENDLKNYDLPPPPPAKIRLNSKRGVQDWIKTHSALYLFLSYELNTRPATRRIFEKLGLSRNIDQLTHKNDDDPAAIDATARAAAVLLAGHDDGLVLLIPSRALWHGGHRDSERAIHEKVATSLQAQHLRVIDMKTVFENASTNPLAFYFVTDSHWNAEGHRLAAETLATAITNTATRTP